MTEQTMPTHKRRGRSPNYPGIDLGEAIERARQLYEHELKYPAPIDTIFAHWKYKPNSGPALVAIAALKRFGLLVEEGSGSRRKARLSDRAVAILLDDREDSKERLRHIQEAALEPPIHQELWNRYAASLPSDSNLRYVLQTEKAFTEAGAKDFISQYKRTIAFAKLAECDTLSEEQEDKLGEEESMTPQEAATALLVKPPSGKHEPETHARVIQIPISASKWVALQAAFPIGDAEWTRMLAVLDAMKPALVSEESRKDQEKS